MSPTNPDLDIITDISAFTIGLLEDSGWYKGNFRNVDQIVFGYGNGCDFITEPCIDNGNVPSHSYNIFCNVTIPYSFQSGFINPNLASNSCNTKYVSKSVCDLQDFTNQFAPVFGTTDPPPPQFNYFPNLNNVSFIH